MPAVRVRRGGNGKRIQGSGQDAGGLRARWRPWPAAVSRVARPERSAGAGSAAGRFRSAGTEQGNRRPQGQIRSGIAVPGGFPFGRLGLNGGWDRSLAGFLGFLGQGDAGRMGKPKPDQMPADGERVDAGGLWPGVGGPGGKPHRQGDEKSPTVDPADPEDAPEAHQPIPVQEDGPGAADRARTDSRHANRRNMVRIARVHGVETGKGRCPFGASSGTFKASIKRRSTGSGVQCKLVGSRRRTPCSRSKTHP
jgi:hypothetical protein